MEEREEGRDGGEKREERRWEISKSSRATEEAKVRGCIGNRLARGWKGVLRVLRTLRRIRASLSAEILFEGGSSRNVQVKYSLGEWDCRC